jgi:uridine kinase
MSIRALLKKQYDLYPKMQIQDMIKLIHQNEFADGHMINNEYDSLRRLEDELRLLDQVTQKENVFVDDFEDIGNNLCRLNLTALKHNDISTKTINRISINTANSVYGSIQRFEEKLDELRQCCKDGQLPYSLEDLEAYLCYYKKKRYPPVSHSEIYREAYFPAYRIVRSEYRDFFEVFYRIDSLIKSKDRIKIAIDGNSGAGKSTLASLIGNIYECSIFHMDDFFLTPELKTQERMEEVGGNVDYIRFKREVIDGINSGREFQYHAYDCKQMVLGQPIPVIPRRINIIEGSYSMHPTLINHYDLKIFLHTDEKTQRSRILQRNGAIMLKRFLNEWIPLENRYFKQLNIREKSDLIFNTKRLMQDVDSN